MPLNDPRAKLFTDCLEDAPYPEFGYNIAKPKRRHYLPLPGHDSREVLIAQMIEANQLLRDQLIDARDELVLQGDLHRKRLAAAVLKPKRKAKKTVARKKK